MCMKKQTLVRDATVMLLALFAAYAMVMLTQAVMGRIEGVAMLIFMLAVFVTSMYTEGYAWGVAASLISVLAVNFAFLSPYFAFNFTLSENLFSGLVMLVVSIMTSTLTTRIKKQAPKITDSAFGTVRGGTRRMVSDADIAQNPPSASPRQARPIKSKLNELAKETSKQESVSKTANKITT